VSFFKRLFTREQTSVFAVEDKTVKVYGGFDWPDFRAALEAYRNPMIAHAVDSVTASILSSGFYFTSEKPEAAEKVSRWAEKVGLRALLFDVIRELVLTGNSFLKPEGRGENLQLYRIPLTWFRPELDVVVDGEKVIVVNYYIDVEAGTYRDLRRVLPASEVIHFAFNVLSPDRPWGCGIAYQLVTRQRDWKGREVPSPLEAEATLRRDLILFMDRSVPKRIIRFDVGDDKLDEIRNKIEPVLKDPGSDFVTNAKFEVGELKAPERLRFEYYQIFENMFTAALRSPVVKLFTTPGFTEASAREATSMFELFTNAVRELVEHVLETKVFPLVTPEHVEIHWGQPQRPELRFMEIIQAARADAYNPAIISREEARKMLRELGWILEEAEAVAAGEAFSFQRGKLVDTLDEVEIYLVPIDDIDKTTIRYYSVDAERGISLAVAWVKSRRERQVVALFFDKKLYDWTPEKARDYYANTFPSVLEKLRAAILPETVVRA
jgi:hypothetical protein